MSEISGCWEGLENQLAYPNPSKPTQVPQKRHVFLTLAIRLCTDCGACVYWQQESLRPWRPSQFLLVITGSLGRSCHVETNLKPPHLAACRGGDPAQHGNHSALQHNFLPRSSLSFLDVSRLQATASRLSEVGGPRSPNSLSKPSSSPPSVTNREIKLTPYRTSLIWNTLWDALNIPGLKAQYQSPQWEATLQQRCGSGKSFWNSAEMMYLSAGVLTWFHEKPTVLIF